MKTNELPFTPGAVAGAPLIWLRLEGAAVFILSILCYAHSGASWWRFGLLLFTPDIAMVAYWAGPRLGSIFYNLSHSYVSPALLAGLALVADWHQLLLFALIWTGHIGMDRAFGYGLKYPLAFQTTHLGPLRQLAAKS